MTVTVTAIVTVTMTVTVTVCEAHCLPNLLAGGLPAGLALAAHRGKHTRATQKSTTHARHTKRDLWRDTREGYERSDRVGRPLLLL